MSTLVAILELLLVLAVFVGLFTYVYLASRDLYRDYIKRKNETPEEREVRLGEEFEQRMEKERKDYESSMHFISIVGGLIVLVVILAIVKWAFTTLVS